MATADFEARQLLKAYRKGLITDELFEAQMRELQGVARVEVGTRHRFGLEQPLPHQWTEVIRRHACQNSRRRPVQ